MTTSTLPHALSVYRTLLRAINKNITSASGNRAWIEHARQQFEASRHNGDHDHQALQKAMEYASLINAVKHHKVCLQLFNR